MFEHHGGYEGEGPCFTTLNHTRLFYTQNHEGFEAMDENPPINAKGKRGARVQPRCSRTRPGTPTPPGACGSQASGQTLHEYNQSAAGFPLVLLLPSFLFLVVGLVNVYRFVPLVKGRPDTMRYTTGNFWTAVVGNLPGLGILFFLPSVWTTNAACESNWGWVRTFCRNCALLLIIRPLQSYNSKGQNPCEVAASLQGACFGERTDRFYLPTLLLTIRLCS